jgi:hypothetical protein
MVIHAANLLVTFQCNFLKGKTLFLRLKFKPANTEFLGLDVAHDKMNLIKVSYLTINCIQVRHKQLIAGMNVQCIINQEILAFIILDVHLVFICWKTLKNPPKTYLALYF